MSHSIAKGLNIHRSARLLGEANYIKISYCATVGDRPTIGQRRCRMRVDTAPSSSTESWDGLSTTMPSSDRSHANRPHSSRLANRQRPPPSHHNSLSRSPRRPRKQTRDPRTDPARAPSAFAPPAAEPFAHVGGTRRQPHPAARRQRVDRSSSITCRSVWALTSPRRCTRPHSQTRSPMTALAIRPPRLTVIRREPSRHFRTLLLATAAAAI
jgi:hypothetical protein